MQHVAVEAHPPDLDGRRALRAGVSGRVAPQRLFVLAFDPPEDARAQPKQPGDQALMLFGPSRLVRRRARALHVEGRKSLGDLTLCVERHPAE